MDATPRGEGALEVRMRWTGLEGPVEFHALDPRHYVVSDVSASVGDLQVPVDVGPGSVRMARADAELSYRVRPGVLGRHGHQGWVSESWAVFDGRAFLLPVGGVDPASISVRFELPDGWGAVTPWEAEGAAFRVPASEHVGAEASLSSTCIGLGPGVDSAGEGLRVAWLGTPADPELEQQTRAVHGWFAKVLGFDARPFSVVWTERAAPEGIFGGSSAHSTCFERPEAGRVRNLELLAHRLAHAMNRYRPSGMAMRDTRDRWFVEGLASWAEIRATASVGVVPDESRWNVLHRRHSRRRASGLAMRVPLAEEPQVRDPEVQEYLHYTLAPLVVRLLEARMMERSGVRMEDFVSHLVSRHGGFRGPVPLREAVETFTGDSYDDFWAAHVDQVTAVPPVWPESVGDAPSPVVARAAGWPVTEALLLAMGRSGRFEHFESIREFTVDAGTRLADLERREWSVVPDGVTARFESLPGAMQLDLMQAALDQPMDAVPEPRSRGCSGPDPLPHAVFDPGGQTPLGASLRHALSAERRTLVQWGQHGVDRLAVRRDQETDTTDRLVVSERDDLRLFTQWGKPPREATFEVLDGDTVLLSKTLVIDPTWKRSFVSFPAGSRTAGDRWLTFRVLAGERVLAERLIWQHRAGVGQ